MKKFLCALLVLCFISTSIFAQTASQVNSFLNSSQGKDFLQSDQGKEMLNQVSGEKKAETEAGQDFLEIDEADKDKDKDKEMPPSLSEIEKFFSADLIAQQKEPIYQYGYEFFKSDEKNTNQRQSSFSFLSAQDSINVPVSPNYILGPGDSFKITLWGITEGIFEVEINGDGDIVLPKVGIVEVAGLSYGDLKPFLEEKLGRYYESVNVGVTMGKLRGFKVYLAGEVLKPGAYNLTSVSSVFEALLAAGGPTKKGSMRKIQLVRGNRSIADIDLYSFFISGRQANSPQLQEGDTIFVPIIGEVVAITGAIPRPAIFEIKGRADLSDLLFLAGGLLPTSYLSRVQVTRIEAHEKKVVKDENINLERSKQKFGFQLKSMDLVEIFPIYQMIENQIFLEGAVKYPGAYELIDGMRVKDLFPSSAIFEVGAYFPQIEVVRVEKENFKTKIFPLDVERLFAGVESENIALQPGDRVVVSAIKNKQSSVVL
ncbi:MAG: SLBB domain-containing protein, partial [Candidatus Margulisbacteria bacterium]|nr:SLBB domain-containing protein [Candidatus Margulisiibacteriota bacterium]